MKKYILSLVMLLICSITASAQQFKVMKGDKNVKTYTINQVDSIAIDEVEGVEVFKLMLGGKTVATYNRTQADRIEVCKGKMVTGITGVPATLDILAGSITKLNATVNKDASDQTLTWSSSDESVVMVSQEGHVAAINEGTATVTATANDGSGKSASCEVSVTVYNPVTSVSLNKTTATLFIGGTEAKKTTTLSPVFNPTNATNKNVTWTSDKPSVATVSDAGVVTAVAVGTANITVKTEEGSYTASCKVTVNQLATSVTLNASTAELVLGGTAAQKTTTLTATAAPSNATDKSVTWTSSDETVATVANNGVVTAVKAGIATITATTNDGSQKSASCTVTVKQLATSVTLNKTTATLTLGSTDAAKTTTLTATVGPNDATDKSVKWTSSDATIATVSETGVVTALKAGTVTIKATANDDSKKYAECTVTVKQLITSISLTDTEIGVGGNETLTVTINPSDATDKSLTWTSSDTDVATVDATGKVTVSESATVGATVTITATAQDGSGKSATCTVTVKEAAGQQFTTEQLQEEEYEW